MKTFRSLLIGFVAFIITTPGYTVSNNTRAYLKSVLKTLENIDSISYSLQSEAWQPGDTTALFVNQRHYQEIRNPKDSTIGASFIIFDNRQRFDFGYDGHVRVMVYHDKKEILIDDFTVRPLPFRPVSAPFFNYTESILRYTLQTSYSVQVDLKDEGNYYFFRLTICEEKQVEFFGKAYHMPQEPTSHIDPTSIYELWIDKTSNLPFKCRRAMSHDISVATVTNIQKNELKAELDLYAYFPKGYEIRAYGEKTPNRSNSLIGSKAPDWSLKDINGDIVTLSALKHKAVLLQFTGIGCGPCLASIPFLNTIANQFNPGDLAVVAIEAWAEDSRQSHHNYVLKNNISYTFLAATDEVIDNYQTGRVAPVFFILDGERVIQQVFNGYNQTISKEITITLQDAILHKL